jgi:hypothetical protein
MVVEYGVMLLVCAVLALALALLSTLALLFVSRRATLRQVNASLIEISKELKRLNAVKTG